MMRFPSKYFPIDLLLGIWSFFHVFIALTLWCPVDAWYKRRFLQLHYAIVKPVFDIPFLLVGLTHGLQTVALYLGYQSHVVGDDEATLRAVAAAYTWVACLLLQRASASLAQLGPDQMFAAEQERERQNIGNYTAPAKWIGHLIVDPLNVVLRPVVYGMEHLSTDAPALYVSNHSLWGIEMPSLVASVYFGKNIYLRGISDRFHFGFPHGALVRFFGGVNGTRENVDCLMESRQHILVYPGGALEVWKPAAIPKYQLMWKERLGFVRCAIKHGYPIVPCCGVGTADMLETIWDIDIGFTRKGLTFPVPVVYPHWLQREYYWFGEPIPTSQYNGDWENDDHAKELRDKVKAAVEAGIQLMLKQQAKDPNRFLWKHIRNVVSDKLDNVLPFHIRSTKNKTVD